MNVQGLYKKTIPRVNTKMECIQLGSNRSDKRRFSQFQASLKGEQMKFSNVERTVGTIRAWLEMLSDAIRRKTIG